MVPELSVRLWEGTPSVDVLSAAYRDDGFI